jgi:hypothetical protein
MRLQVPVGLVIGLPNAAEIGLALDAGRAGGSLMGVVLVFWANGGSILSKLFGG